MQPSAYDVDKLQNGSKVAPFSTCAAQQRGIAIVTFTVKIALQPFEVAFEAGSIAEAVAILQEPDNELSKLAALATGQGEEEETTAPTTTEAEKPATKRGRKSKAAVEAVAPAPIPVPDAAPPAPPVPAAPADTGIPPFLDRTNQAAPVAVAPPPPLAAPPAPAPVSPPVGVLAGKVVAELKRRGDGAADQGAGLVTWLAGAGLCVPGASFQEAVDCVLFLDDAKLGPVATALGVS